MAVDPRFGRTFISGGAGAAVYADNLLLDAMHMQSVTLTVGGNTPPGSPASGDMHVIGTSPTGAWAGKANNVTMWTGTEWVFFAPFNGYEIYNRGDSKRYRYTTLWTEIVSGGGGSVLIQSQTASNSPQIDFTNLNDTYDQYALQLIDIVPVTDDADLWLRVSTDGGSTFLSGASDYAWMRFHHNIEFGAATAIDAADAQIVVTQDIGNAAGEGLCGTIRIMNPRGTRRKAFIIETIYMAGAPAHAKNEVWGWYIGNDANNIEGLRFLCDAGNISSGVFRLYGLTK